MRKDMTTEPHVTKPPYKGVSDAILAQPFEDKGRGCWETAWNTSPKSAPR